MDDLTYSKYLTLATVGKTLGAYPNATADRPSVLYIDYLKIRNESLEWSKMNKAPNSSREWSNIVVSQNYLTNFHKLGQ